VSIYSTQQTQTELHEITHNPFQTISWIFFTAKVKANMLEASVISRGTGSINIYLAISSFPASFSVKIHEKMDILFQRYIVLTAILQNE